MLISATVMWEKGRKNKILCHDNSTQENLSEKNCYTHTYFFSFIFHRVTDIDCKSGMCSLVSISHRVEISNFIILYHAADAGVISGLWDLWLYNNICCLVWQPQPFRQKFSPEVVRYVVTTWCTQQWNYKK